MAKTMNESGGAQILYDGQSIGPFKVVLSKSQRNTMMLFDIPDNFKISLNGIDDLEIQVQIKESKHVEVKQDVWESSLDQCNLPGFGKELNEALEYLSACIDLKTTIRLSTPSPGGLLIYGGTGSGKTSFCKSLQAEMIVKKICKDFSFIT